MKAIVVTAVPCQRWFEVMVGHQVRAVPSSRCQRPANVLRKVYASHNRFC